VLIKGDAEAGLLEVQGDDYQVRQYVRRRKNVPLPRSPHVLTSLKVPGEFARGPGFDGEALPDTIIVAVVKVGTADWGGSPKDVVSADEYRADGFAYAVWQKMTGRTPLERRKTVPKDVMELLKGSQESQGLTMDVVRKEMQRWEQDKSPAEA
jgi:hypothetical protein